MGILFIGFIILSWYLYTKIDNGWYFVLTMAVLLTGLFWLGDLVQNIVDLPH